MEDPIKINDLGDTTIFENIQYILYTQFIYTPKTKN